MSVASEINRIKSNIADAYTEAEAKGATMPATENSDNLAQTVASIPGAVQPTLITKQIAENGTYAAEDDNADGYSEVVVEVGKTIEEKDVNFYDCDGTLLYSYTLSEVQQLTELPPFPTNNDYTYQEWNRSLASIKASVQGADIAAIVTPKIADESGELGFTIYEGDPTELSLSLKLARCGATIHWGDNTTTYISSASFGGETIVSAHQYTPSSFPYSFKINIVYDGAPSGYDKIVFLNPALSGIWAQRLKSIAVSQYVIPSSNSFMNCRSLERVYFSKNFRNSFSYYTFAGCNNLKTVFLPNINYVGNGEFINCYSLILLSLSDNFLGTADYGSFQNSSLKFVRLNNSIVSLGQGAFNGITTLGRIYIPKTVTYIRSRAFKDCSNLLRIDMSAFTDPNNLPELANVDALSGTPADQIIDVANQEMLTAFSGATNWSTYASRFQIKPSGV